MNISFFYPLSGRTKMKGCHGEAWSCRGRKKGKKNAELSGDLEGPETGNANCTRIGGEGRFVRGMEDA